MLAETHPGRSASLDNEEPGRPVGKERGKAKWALLVDDHDLFRQVLAVILERNTGVDESLQAGSTAEARVVADGHTGDELVIAIVDLDLPDGDVFELIVELRQKNIPVLAITTPKNLEQGAWSLGVNGALSTAASSDDILGAARRLIDR